MSKKKGTKLTDLIAAELRPTPPAPPAPVLTNHIIYLLDESGSMRGCYAEAVRQLNLNFKTVRDQARATRQKTTVSLYTFGNDVIRRFFQIPAEELKDLSSYSILGPTTPLYDAVCDAVDDATVTRDSSDPNTSFLVICATDGYENNSRRHNSWAMMGRLRSAQGTDRWTFAFMVPSHASKNALEAMGVPGNNIVEWQNTEQGAREVFTQANSSTANYYAQRSLGVKATKAFFTTDLSKLSKTETSKMEDVSGNFKSWAIDKEIDIKAFVEEKGHAFYLGAGYYMLMKKEQLRSGRKVILIEKGTNRIYGGDQARQLLGLPSGNVYVTPGNHANYDIYFQSTSVNRKLVRGTRLYYDRTQTRNEVETWDSEAARLAAEAKKQNQPQT